MTMASVPSDPKHPNPHRIPLPEEQEGDEE